MTDVCAGRQRESDVVLMLLLFGQTLLGIGGVPIQPFGISYIDDYASATNSPLYIGTFLGTTMNKNHENRGHQAFSVGGPEGKGKHFMPARMHVCTQGDKHARDANRVGLVLA